MNLTRCEATCSVSWRCLTWLLSQCGTGWKDFVNGNWKMRSWLVLKYYAAFFWRVWGTPRKSQPQHPVTNRKLQIKSPPTDSVCHWKPKEYKSMLCHPWRRWTRNWRHSREVSPVCLFVSTHEPLNKFQLNLVVAVWTNNWWGYFI